MRKCNPPSAACSVASASPDRSFSTFVILSEAKDLCNSPRADLQRFFASLRMTSRPNDKPESELRMSKFAEPMSRLIDELKKLPGVGAKSAQRLAFYILRASDEDAEALATAVRDVKANLRLCSVCNNITDVDPCVYCTSATRNQRLVCVVEEPTNIAAIEKTKHFNGVFHVLHGAISPLHGIGPEQLRISNLITRVDAGNVDEVIVATNPTVEGEATATYLSQQLKRSGVKVTRIAMGIPVGSDIEYTDEITMLKAMEGRRDM